MPLWKKILLRSAGFGAGFAITLCVVVGVWIWYIERPKPPKPWDKQAITAEYDNVSTAGDENFFSVQYILQNNTDVDYRLDSDSGVEISAKLQQQKGLAEFSRKTIAVEFPVFVPAKNRVRLPIILKYHYPVREKNDPTLEERKQFRTDVAKYITNEFKNLDGFVLFDTTNRYEIDFPTGWEKRAKEPSAQK